MAPGNQEYPLTPYFGYCLFNAEDKKESSLLNSLDAF